MTNKLENSIVEKIQKMLATANDKAASESEAQNALLMAQKFMAKHGLEMTDVIAHADEDQKKEVVSDFTESQKTEWWQGRLATIVANNFRCFIYVSKYSGNQRIVFVGVKEDAEIAKTVYMFAASVLPHLAKKYLKDRKKKVEKASGYSFKDMTDKELYEIAENELSDFELYELKNKYPEEKTYKMRLIMAVKKALGLEIDASGIKNDYMQGFLNGLEAQFKEQVEANKAEWGLVLVKDKEVVEYYDKLNLRSGTRSSAKASGDREARGAGFQQGKSWSSPKGGLN